MYDTYKMSQYFPKLQEHSSRNIEVELDLSNYAIKADLKGASHIDTSNLEVTPDLPSLKAQVDEIDADKLKTANLSKLSNIVYNVARKTLYDKLVTKVNAIGTVSF